MGIGKHEKGKPVSHSPREEAGFLVTKNHGQLAISPVRLRACFI